MGLIPRASGLRGICREVRGDLTPTRSMRRLWGKAFAPWMNFSFPVLSAVSHYIASLYPQQALHFCVNLWLSVLAHVLSSLEAPSSHTLTLTLAWIPPWNALSPCPQGTGLFWFSLVGPWRICVSVSSLHCAPMRIRCWPTWTYEAMCCLSSYMILTAHFCLCASVYIWHVELWSSVWGQ
jgi:hypothetical protein